ncbi:MAG: alpha/beta fold hydrolase [Acidimicrobiia bacterium]|jgi:pimeloyl-ACP methyl ester carboxylesterase|nr:alpha/beta fold hydrolase [Acidimicrobiia bacterium]MBP8181931.1 alpha/beta fold hydrolase [Acidimicrobiia bacterium]
MASNGAIDLYYETFGDPTDPPVLLIMGLGTQLIGWHDDFCAGLAQRGLYVIRFDNRDVGWSTKLTDLDGSFAGFLSKGLRLLAGLSVTVPYSIADMADDAVAVLDAVGAERAHIVGASMGGMIAQQVAISFPSRALSLTSIMSTTGDRDVGGSSLRTKFFLARPPASDPDKRFEAILDIWRRIGSPAHFDEQDMRRRLERSFERDYSPNGRARQLLAVLSQSSRTAGLRSLQLPTTAIHGLLDPLVNPSGSRRLAASVPDAKLIELPDVAHDMPRVYWPVLFDVVEAHNRQTLAVA